MATPRQSRSWYSKVGLHAPLNEPSGTSVAGQRRKLRYGSKTGFVNRRLREDQAIDPASSYWCPRLYGQVLTYGTSVNIGSYTFPLYEAKHNTPRIYMQDVQTDRFMNTDGPYAWGPGPTNWPWEGSQGTGNPEDKGWRSNDAEIPATVGRDRSVVVIDPNDDSLYEAWQVLRKDGTFGYPNNPPHDYPNVEAFHGGRIRGLSRFSGAFPNPWGLTGTSISAGVGLILKSECDQGVIPHQVKFAVAVGTTAHRRPATRGDQTGGTNDFPEGAQIRLPYDFDIDAYCASTGNVQTSFCRMVIQAAKDYGMVCNDAATGVVGVAGVEDLRPAPNFTSNNLSWYDHMFSPVKTGLTGNAAADTLTLSGHGLSAGEIVVFRTLTGGAGLNTSPDSVTQGYYRVLDTPTPGVTFRVTTDGGTVPINFTTDITAGSLQGVQWGYVLLHPNRFPWQHFQLLPETDN